MAAAGGAWRHGLALARETGLQSGTLYPLLIRLADAGFLDSRWEAPERPGRPPRHAYRLTAAGKALAIERSSEACRSGPAGALA